MIVDLWEKTILPFLTGKAFEIAGFAILWWYVIVAAAAAVVLLLIVTIAVACSKKKKKKEAKENVKQETGESIHKKKNKAQVQPFSDVAPDWQPVAVAPKLNKKEQKQAAKLEKQQAKAAANEEKIAEEPIEELQVTEEPIATESIATEPIVEETVSEQVEQKAIVKETVAPAETIVAPTKPITPTKQQIAESVAVAQKEEEVEAAERIRPASNNFQTFQPKPAATPVQKTVVQKPQKVAQPVQKPVAQPEPAATQTAPAPAPRYQTPITKPQRVTPTVVEEEVVATTAPRALPKKTTKATKKTADQIADDIQAKTGTNPRKKSDTPAVVGKDKLPKKPAKAKKADTTQSKANEPATDELPLITTDPNVESFGKFVIIKNDDNSARPYHFRLLANNGQILFESESYKSKPKSNSITAFKKAAVEENFEIDVDKAGNWRYKLYNNAHSVIGVGESYSTKQGCENSVQSVIKFAESARFLEDQTVDEK